MGKTGHVFRLALILAAAGACFATAESGYFRTYRVTLASGIHRSLMNELSMENMIPGGVDRGPGRSETMIYVLGSTQERLKYHLRTAAVLYNSGIGEKIYILSRPGMTEYSPKLLRNLTNDEWSVRELGILGVPPGDVEAVPVPSGFFGTFCEGSRISRFARERGYKRLVLVSSPHHARRVHLTFSHFACAMNVSVQPSSDTANLATLFAEYFKYVWYRRLLIPAPRLAFLASEWCG